MDTSGNQSSKIRSFSRSAKPQYDGSNSQKSFFNNLDNTQNFVSYLKNGYNTKRQTSPNMDMSNQGLSDLKRRVLDLKCKLSSLQCERTKKIELETKLQRLLSTKNQKENMNRVELEALMRKLSTMKGNLEEEKTVLQRMRLKKEQKLQDAHKMEELLDAKSDELAQIKMKKDEFSKENNRLSGQKDSLEKEEFLLKEETSKLELDEARLQRQLAEKQIQHKNALAQTEKLQVERLF